MQGGYTRVKWYVEHRRVPAAMWVVTASAGVPVAVLMRFSVGKRYQYNRDERRAREGRAARDAERKRELGEAEVLVLGAGGEAGAVSYTTVYYGVYGRVE